MPQCVFISWVLQGSPLAARWLAWACNATARADTASVPLSHVRTKNDEATHFLFLPLFSPDSQDVGNASTGEDLQLHSAEAAIIGRTKARAARRDHLTLLHALS